MKLNVFKDELNVIGKLPSSDSNNNDEKTKSIYIHRYENPLLNFSKGPVCKFKSKNTIKINKNLLIYKYIL